MGTSSSFPGIGTNINQPDVLHLLPLLTILQEEALYLCSLFWLSMSNLMPSILNAEGEAL